MLRPLLIFFIVSICLFECNAQLTVYPDNRVLVGDVPTTTTQLDRFSVIGSNLTYTQGVSVQRIASFRASSSTANLLIGSKLDGTQNTMQFFNGLNNDGHIGFVTRKGSSNYQRLFIQNDGNIGINNSSPLYTLDIDGDVYIRDNLLVGGTTTSKITLNGNDAYIKGQLEAAGTGGSYIHSLALGDYDPIADIGNLITSGQIGIGTSSPLGKLHTVNSTYNGSPIFQTTALNSSSGIRLRNDDNTHEFGLITGNSINANYGDFAVYHTQSGKRLLHIESGGNIGIGTTSPDAKLSVYNDLGINAGNHRIANFKRISIGTGNAGMEIGYTANGSIVENSYQFIPGGVDFAIATFDGGYSEKLYLENTGNVGIGTTSPSSTLDIDGDLRIRSLQTNSSENTLLVAKTDGTVEQREAANVAFSGDYNDLSNLPTINNGDADWTISGNDLISGPSGNVGIGTTPTNGAKLHVNGKAMSTLLEVRNSSTTPILDFVNDNTSDFDARISLIDDNELNIDVGSVLSMSSGDHISLDGGKLKFENGIHSLANNDGAGNFSFRIANEVLLSPTREIFTEDGYAFQEEWAQSSGQWQWNISNNTGTTGSNVTWGRQLLLTPSSFSLDGNEIATQAWVNSLPGGFSGNFTDLNFSGTSGFNDFNDDVNDADFDPLNEIQTISAAGSATIYTALLSGGGGGGAPSAISFEEGTGITIDRSNNILKFNAVDGFSGNFTDLNFSGTSGFNDFNDDVNDADFDPTNEYNTDVELDGTLLKITDGGGTLTEDLSALVPASHWASGPSNSIHSTNTGFVGIGTASSAPQDALTIKPPAGTSSFVRHITNITSGGLLGGLKLYNKGLDGTTRYSGGLIFNQGEISGDDTGILLQSYTAATMQTYTKFKIDLEDRIHAPRGYINHPDQTTIYTPNNYLFMDANGQILQAPIEKMIFPQRIINSNNGGTMQPINLTDHYINVTVSGAHLVLPITDVPIGKVFVVKIRGDHWTINLDVNLSGQIDDVLNIQVMDSDYGSITVKWNGSSYDILSRYNFE